MFLYTYINYTAFHNLAPSRCVGAMASRIPKIAYYNSLELSIINVLVLWHHKIFNCLDCNKLEIGNTGR